MDKQEIYTDDVLGRYLNQESAERAPEGFTSNVMNRIRFDAEPVHKAGRININNIVPAIYTMATAVLLVVAYFTAGQETNTLPFSLDGLFKNIQITFRDFNLFSFLRVNHISIILYMIAAICILVLFDKALKVFFLRTKREE